MSIFKKKKVQEEPKKVMSLTEMKIKVSMMNSKMDTYIHKMQVMCDKYIAKAIEKKKHNQDNSLLIKRISACKNKILQAERWKDIWENQLDNYEMLELQKGCLGVMGEMAESFSALEMTEEDKKTQDKIVKAMEAMSYEEQKMVEAMNMMGSAMDAMQDQEALNDTENEINRSIMEAVNDAALSSNSDTNDITNKVKQKIGLGSES